MTQNRKRTRSITEDEVPLSKRINNLHIHNGHQNNPAESSNFQMHDGQQPSHIHHMPVLNNNLVDHHNSYMAPSHNMNPNFNQPQYNPALGESENPYYHQNRLLHELHFQKMYRILNQNNPDELQRNAP